MPTPVQRALRQQKPFASLEAEVFVALQLATARHLDPWARYLRSQAGLTTNQYNVLRILRGAHPRGVTCGAIVERMITRDPDVTRLTDRLVEAGLARRERSEDDRRVVEVRITPPGLALLARLDRQAERLLEAHLGSIGEARLRTLLDLLGIVIAAAPEPHAS